MCPNRGKRTAQKLCRIEGGCACETCEGHSAESVRTKRWGWSPWGKSGKRFPFVSVRFPFVSVRVRGDVHWNRAGKSAGFSQVFLLLRGLWTVRGIIQILKRKNACSYHCSPSIFTWRCLWLLASLWRVYGELAHPDVTSPFSSAGVWLGGSYLVHPGTLILRFLESRLGSLKSKGRTSPWQAGTSYTKMAMATALPALASTSSQRLAWGISSLLFSLKKNPALQSFLQCFRTKKNKKAVAQHAYPLLAYSFGYSFTAVYISNNPFNFFREMLCIYNWHLDGITCHKPVCSYPGSEYRRRICFTDILEFLHGQLAGFVFWNISEHLQEKKYINSIKWWQDFWFTDTAGLNFHKNI